MTTPASETPAVVEAPAPVVEAVAPVVEAVREPADHTGVTVNDPTGVDPLPTGDFAPADNPPADETATEEPKWEAEADWKYDFLEFKGDRLAVRIPSGAALNALNMAQSRKVSDVRRATLTRDLLTNHLSEASFDRVFFDRSANPDEPDYDVNTLGELLGELLTRAGDRLTAEMEALKQVTN